MRDREEVAKAIVQAFYFVRGELGVGFLEKVYENALAMELRERGYFVQQQQPIKVFFKGSEVGDYFAGLLVEKSVLVELKVVEMLASKHEAQLLNYLKASEIALGLLLNFGPKPEVKRKIYETARLP
jgi:GxxExxY protein